MPRRIEGLLGKGQAEPGCPGRNMVCMAGGGPSCCLLTISAQQSISRVDSSPRAADCSKAVVFQPIWQRDSWPH